MRKAGLEPFEVAPGGEPFQGFRWHKDEAVKLNFIWMLFHIHGKSLAGHVSKVWFDNIVAAKEYIGPLGK